MQILIESTVLLFALFCGSVRYNSQQVLHKLFFLQLGVWVAFYLVSHLIEYLQATQGIKQNNHWVFNLSTIAEISLLLITARVFYQKKSSKRAVTLGLLLYTLSTVTVLVMNGILNFNVISFALGSLMVGVAYAGILYHSFHQDKNSAGRKSMLLIASGIFLYFACNLPYFSLFNYLNTHHLKLSQFLFHIITDVFANLRYLLLGIGFLLLPKPKLLST